jgi:hypothetical protein
MKVQSFGIHRVPARRTRHGAGDFGCRLFEQRIRLAMRSVGALLPAFFASELLSSSLGLHSAISHKD